jgi:hypothetical protein
MTTILITSVIHPAEFSLNYTIKRSIFTPKERLSQTIETINSVKKHFPESRIVLADCSLDNGHIENQELQDAMSSGNIILDLSNDSSVSKWVHSSNKNMGECSIVNSTLSKLNLQGEIYKLSGRYTLENSFNSNIFDKNKNYNVRTIHTAWEGLVCLSSFYRVANSVCYTKLVDFVCQKYLKEQNKYISMEKMLYMFLNTIEENTYQSIDSILGIRGEIAPTGKEEIN